MKLVMMSAAMDRLRADLRYEPTEKRIRADLGGHPVLDTTRALLVWEPRRITPTYAVPRGDLRAELSPAAGTQTPDGLLHPGVPFAAHSTEGEPLTVTAHGQTRVGAAFRAADPDLARHVVLDFDAFDRWREEDEPLRGHPRDPYHRVDARVSSRHVVIAHRGRTLADTVAATFVYETSLPTRFYVPRRDLVTPLENSRTTTYCPYKGEAGYLALDGKDVAWSYRSPLADAAPLADLVAFYDDIMDVTVDGVRRPRPDTPVARMMLDEFGVS